MSTLILEIDNDLDVSKVLELLKPLNVRVKEENETAKHLEAVKASFDIIKQDKVIELDSLSASSNK